MLAAGSAVGLLLSLAAPGTGAHAATVSYSGTTTLSPYLGAGAYTFPGVPLPRFDVPGQCLTSVCVRLEGQTIGFLGIENYENFPKVVNVTWSAKFDLLRPSLAPLLTVTPTVLTSDSLTTFDGSVDYAGTSGVTHSGLAAAAADSTCLTAGADLALFSGPGTITLPVTASNTSSHDGANSWTFGIQGGAIIQLTYTYVPCSTPVRPTTWGQLKSTYR
jgi:hypothetical protein